MSFVILGRDSYRVVPWKNGQGTTTELIRVPDDDPWHWRVSIADVSTDGPFSRFEGCDRIIMTIEGQGMRLTHPATGSEATIFPFEPYEFDGDVETSCSLLQGPVRDFNVIYRRDILSAAVEVIRGTLALRDVRLIYCAEGKVEVQAEGKTLTLSAGESAIARQNTECEITPVADAIAIAVGVLPGSASPARG